MAGATVPTTLKADRTLSPLRLATAENGVPIVGGLAVWPASDVSLYR